MRQTVPLLFLCMLVSLTRVGAIHHMKRHIEERQSSGGSIPLMVTNMCNDTIYPGINTQGGQGPQSQGFELQSGANNTQYVSENWQGRVWGRTNCSFNSQGTGPSGNGYQACNTGDCNGVVNCSVTGNTPVTLAEFTLDGGDGQTYYDISLVDGYNLPMAIVLLPLSNASFQAIPPNLTNPSCIGTVGDFNPSQSYSPYSDGQQATFLGTNSSSPLPFANNISYSDVANWCPWDLQVSPPKGPGDGVYPYPDSTIQRPIFNPCLSACARYNSDSDCCNGKYNSPTSCSPNYYSTAAKSVCPDAYSFAYDDQTSTFIIPAGAGFAVVFCPGERSTDILATSKQQLNRLAGKGFGAASSSSGGMIGSLASSTLAERDGRTWCRAVLTALVVVAWSFVAGC
ncbi:hypothetical protein LTR66_006237 [Elasticomyces elasticus]|nr:hypothetical protein LTR66_006237 [Elasticomyces elasticus]